MLWLPYSTVLLVILGVLTCVLALKWLKATLAWLRANSLCNRLPGPHSSHWLLGMQSIISCPNTAHRQMCLWAKQYGDLYHIRILHKQMVVVSSPAKVQKILGQDFRLNKPPAYDESAYLTSSRGEPNLITMRTDDPMWKLARKGVAAAFATKQIRRGFEVAKYYSHQLVSILLAKGPKEALRMDELVTTQALDVIAKFGFDVDLGLLKGECSLIPGMNVRRDFFMGNCEANARCYDRLRRHKWWNKSQQQGDAAIRRLQRLNHAMLAAYRGKQRSGEVAEDDVTIGSALLALRHPATGLPLDDEVLSSHVGILFWAGHDTTANTLCYILYLLSQHSEVEAKLVSELKDAGLMRGCGTAAPRELVLGDLAKLPYLQAVVKEGMRVLPTAAVVARQAEHDVMLDGYLIPAGTEIFVSFLAMNRIYFEDGDSFKPERWIQDPQAHLWVPAANGAAHPDAGGVRAGVPCLQDGAGSLRQLVEPQPLKRFMPFADGPRDCVGQNLAAVMIPTTLACLLCNFHFELVPGFDHGSVDTNAISMRPEHGVSMLAIPRVAV